MFTRADVVRAVALVGQLQPRHRRRVAHSSRQAKQKPRSLRFGDLLVAPTGVDPVTFRFSVERSTN